MAHIKIYTRIKPTADVGSNYSLADANSTLCVRVATETSGGHDDRSATYQRFKCSHVFTEKATQAELFTNAAKDIVEGFLAGYNGTIFAYGQTGTGKTYTMDGSARRYEDRGIAPRTLSLIYEQLENRQDDEISVHISYMEIYQEVGYDLLNPAARSNSLVMTFPKVSVVEGVNGSCLVRNLSTHLAANEQVAQNLLLQGQANRRVAETPLNHRSSRSHAIFTVQLTSWQHQSEVITRSKLHLVDLAGSERVAKSGVKGAQLAEAKFINLSLHHLEGVIVALQQESTGKSSRPRVMQNRWMGSSRPPSPSSTTDATGGSTGVRHIPYRNSLLTMVLRDSLGGNCQTAMIATISFRLHYLGETLSTCRFAQRVAFVTNTVWKNEEVNDKSMIKKLEAKVAQLETELALIGTEQWLPDVEGSTTDTTSLTARKIDCVQIIQGYLIGRIKDPIVAGVRTAFNTRECFRILKSIILDLYGRHDDGVTVQPIAKLAVTKAGFLAAAAKTSLGQLPLVLLDRAGANRAVLQSSRASSAKAPWKRAPNDPQKQGVGAPKLTATRNTDGQETMAVQNGRSNWMRSSAASPAARKPLQKGTPTRDGHKPVTERVREPDAKPRLQEVDKSKVKVGGEQRHLASSSAPVQRRQLELIRSEISRSLDQNQQRLLEQQSRLLQVEQRAGDLDLLHRERLAQQQLQRKQVKMEKRLDMINKQLGEEGGDGRGGKEELEGKTKERGETGKMGEKADGKVGAKTDENHSGEETQGKEGKCQPASSTTLNHQVAEKEMAMREKLLNFREKLRVARLGTTVTTEPTSFTRQREYDAKGLQQTETGVSHSSRLRRETSECLTRVADAVSSDSGPATRDAVVGAEENRPSVTSKLGSIRSGLTAVDRGRGDMLKHISGGVSSEAGLARATKSVGRNAAVRSSVTRSAAGRRADEPTEAAGGGGLKMGAKGEVGVTAGGRGQSGVTVRRGATDAGVTSSLRAPPVGDGGDARRLGRGVSSGVLHGRSVKSAKRDATLANRDAEPPGGAGSMPRVPSTSDVVERSAALGDEFARAERVGYACQSPGGDAGGQTSRSVGVDDESPRALATVAGQFRAAERDAHQIARRTLGVDDRDARPVAATRGQYDAFARSARLREGDGRATGRVKGEGDGRAAGRVNGEGDGTAAGRVNGEGDGRAAGHVNGEGDGRAAGRVNGEGDGTATPGASEDYDGKGAVSTALRTSIKDLPIAEKIALYLQNRKQPKLTDSPLLTPTPRPRPRNQLRSNFDSTSKIRAMPENERKATYMKVAQEQRERVRRIRQAKRAAEVIQRSWRRYRRNLAKG